MDSTNGFGVAHDTVWDGSFEDPSSGLCNQGTPDEQGRFAIYIYDLMVVIVVDLVLNETVL